ncbi:microneme protein MIC2 [Ophiocordyceps camponoti-floridani]|uniref:Microneme protein MIC2 n=1 Tax=Ophiocordyceps camponoti-floridani TaxID=2030778 RepID=A0A8H4QC24_9HYPO|nr:microneme protein MIC2 [Ophiocordyceps camponoti-floridani]
MKYSTGTALIAACLASGAAAAPTSRVSEESQAVVARAESYGPIDFVLGKPIDYNEYERRDVSDGIDLFLGTDDDSEFDRRAVNTIPDAKALANRVRNKRAEEAGLPGVPALPGAPATPGVPGAGSKNGLATLIEAAAGLGKTVGGFGETAHGLGKALGGFTETVGGLGKTVGGIGETLGAAADGMTPILTAATKPALAAASPLINAAAKPIGGVVNPILNAANPILGAADPILNAVKPALGKNPVLNALSGGKNL